MLLKEQSVDLVEITSMGVVQVRLATVITDDGVALPVQHSRYCIVPGEDYSNEPDRVRKICEIVHTPEAIASYIASVAVESVG